MKEYIERELLLIGVDGCISSLHAQAKGDPIQESAIKLVEATRDYIASLSAADVAPVVRCRECARAEESVHPNTVVCVEHGKTMLESDFCSYGEKVN